MNDESKTVCSICGENEAKRWIPCRYRDGWICIDCCMHRCGQYSKRLLPNGTNCKMTSTPRGLYTYVSNPETVAIFRNQFRLISSEKAAEMFDEKKRQYSDCCDAGQRTVIRAQLAALEQIINEAKICRMS